ncbi:diadenylate cyclase domain-containing protein [Aneurinibacillus terranovensis]|uniref:diadenylate cyclase domain-containing protein n=1 Tax=Aneurinibacillus terranovensis TaxID=278991 RepID=UPI00041E3C65|nr:diadenylate cyclase domain-containing protein [Aneurinibacillus terranovensis]
MNESDCDFSFMKQQLNDGLQQITHELDNSLEILKTENGCILLGKIEEIKPDGQSHPAFISLLQ